MQRSQLIRCVASTCCWAGPSGQKERDIFFFILKPVSNIVSNILNFGSNTQYNKSNATQTCFYILYNKFNLENKYYFSMFYEHKNTKLNHFNFISKVANFRVLH